MARTNYTRRGRGRGASGRSPGCSPGRGNNKNSDCIVFIASKGKDAKEFFQSFGIDTKLPTKPNKRNNNLTSPFEGGSQLNKPAPFAAIDTEVKVAPSSQPPTPEATRAILNKTNKTSSSTSLPSFKSSNKNTPQTKSEKLQRLQPN